MRLVDMAGAELIVRSQSAAGWSADVFNVEVHEHHTYHVGLLRTWARNAPCCTAGDGQKYRGVEIVDARDNPLGGFDHIEGNKFVEDKSARRLDIVNPKTGMPYQTANQWARHQIFDKTSTRIENLAIAADTRATREGTPNIPSLANIQGLTQLEFRVENATPAVKKAVAEQIKALQLKFPEWTFTAKFGE